MFVRACLRDSSPSRTEISVASKYSLRHKVRARCGVTTDVVCAAKNIYWPRRCRSAWMQYMLTEWDIARVPPTVKVYDFIS